MTRENLFKAAPPVADSDVLTAGRPGNSIVGTGELFINYQNILRKVGSNFFDDPPITIIDGLLIMGRQRAPAGWPNARGTLRAGA